VEGHELSGLPGGQGLLANPDGPAMMQIEYGKTRIPGGSALKAPNELVDPLGHRPPLPQPRTFQGLRV